MKVVTFVVPAYNSAQFLERGIPSMLVPEVLEKLEIIIVNDGSTDATAAVAQKYCDQYPDTVHLICQENKGHGGALNTGCAAAQGKYLKIIDADDWVLTRNLPEYIRYLEQLDSDVVLTHYHTVNIRSGQVRPWRCYPENFAAALSLEDILARWRSFFSCLTFHAITYNTQFYREYGIRLSEHVFYEDYEFATFPCCRAGTVTALDLFLYEYRIGDVSQSVSDVSKLKRLSHLETVLDRMIREFKRAGDLSAAGQAYVTRKTQELLLSYFTTVLLVEPDKRAGRRKARSMMAYVRKEFPAVADMAEKKYFVFCLMNRLHISKQTWEAFLASGAYRLLRGNRE